MLDIKQSTKSVYKYGLRDFLKWNAERALDATTPIQYKVFLRARTDISTGTKNLYLSAMRALMTQLHRSSVTDRDFGKSVRGFTLSRGHKKSPISDAQVEKVFTYIRKKKDKRLILIFTLLYFQGLRQNEALTIRVEDCLLDERSLWIEGKARDERERVDLHPRTVEIIRWYLNEANIKSGYLLYSKRNATGHISRIQIGRLIAAVHKACGISNGGHGWRKVFTSKLIESGLDLLTVSSFTRHKSIEMLKVYYDRLDKQKKLPTYYGTFDAAVVKTS